MELCDVIQRVGLPPAPFRPPPDYTYIEYEPGIDAPALSLAAAYRAPNESSMTSSSASTTPQSSLGSSPSTSSMTSATSPSASSASSGRFQLSGRFKTFRRRSESSGDAESKASHTVLTAPTAVDPVKVAASENALIGVPLKNLKKDREAKMLPEAATFFVDALLRLGAEDANGIFKKNGKYVEIEKFKKSLNTGVFAMPSDVHVCASVFKLWIRSLPEPLIPGALYEDALRCEVDDEAHKLYERLEEPAKSLVAYIAHFLAHMAQDAVRARTMMNDANIASVFAPCFMKCPYADVNQMLAAQEKQTNFVLALLDAAKNKLIPDPGFERTLEGSKAPIVVLPPPLPPPPQEGGASSASASSAASEPDIPPPSTPPDHEVRHRRRASTRGSLTVKVHRKSTTDMGGYRKTSVSSASGVSVPPPLPEDI